MKKAELVTAIETSEMRDKEARMSHVVKTKQRAQSKVRKLWIHRNETARKSP